MLLTPDINIPIGVGCKATDIDVSMSVFTQLALVEQGRVNVEWAWLEKAP